MEFNEAIASGFKNYVTFAGRASRSEFWFWVLFVTIVSLIAGAVDAFVGLGFIGLLVSLALFLPGLAVSVRRLHDLDRTGWWLLIGFTGIGLILLLIWNCTKGTDGPNRFGSDPLGPI